MLLTLLPVSHARPVEPGLLARPEHLEGSVLADRVRPAEDPVLPGGEPAENTRRHALAAAEAQILFEARQRIGRERGALLDGDAQLVVPVDLIRGPSDEPQLERARRRDGRPAHG